MQNLGLIFLQRKFLLPNLINEQMITVQMTEMEYKAYLLYLKSIEIMQNAGEEMADQKDIKHLFSDDMSKKEFELGLEDLKAGRITYIDPENIWQNIK
jgi:hypothetical protein